MKKQDEKVVRLAKPVRKGLLKREIINGIYHISMHPIIKEVCQTEWILVNGFDYDEVFGGFISNVCESIILYRNCRLLPYSQIRSNIRLLLKIVKNLIKMLDKANDENMDFNINEKTLLPITKIPGVYAEFDDIVNASIVFSLLHLPSISERIEVCLNIHLGIAYGLLMDAGTLKREAENNISVTVDYVLDYGNKKLKEYTEHLCKSDLASYFLLLANHYFDDEEVYFFEEKYDCFCRALDLLSSDNDGYLRTFFELMRVGIAVLNLEIFDENDEKQKQKLAEKCVHIMDKNHFSDFDSIILSGFAEDCHLASSLNIFAFILRGSFLLYKQLTDEALMYYLAAHMLFDIRLSDDINIEEKNYVGNQLDYETILSVIDEITLKYIMDMIIFIYKSKGSFDAMPVCVNERTLDITFAKARLEYCMETTLFCMLKKIS